MNPWLRAWSMAPIVAVLALCWAWGGLVGINAMLDRSSARIVPAEVVEADITSKGGRQLTIRTTRGASETFRHVRVARPLFDRHPQGMPVCMVFHDGALGWHWFAAVDCPAGALR